MRTVRSATSAPLCRERPLGCGTASLHLNPPLDKEKVQQIGSSAIKRWQIYESVLQYRGRRLGRSQRYGVGSVFKRKLAKPRDL